MKNKHGQFRGLFWKNYRTALMLIGLPLLAMMCMMMVLLIRQRVQEDMQRNQAAAQRALEIFDDAIAQQRQAALIYSSNADLRTLFRLDLDQNSTSKTNALSRLSSSMETMLLNSVSMDDVFLAISQTKDDQQVEAFIVRAGSAYRYVESKTLPNLVDFSNAGYAHTSRVYTRLRENNGGFVLVDQDLYYGEKISLGKDSFSAVRLNSTSIRAQLQAILGLERMAVAMNDQIVFDTNAGTRGSSLTEALDQTNLYSIVASTRIGWQCACFYDFSETQSFALRIVGICSVIMLIMMLLSAYLCRRVSMQLTAPYQTIFKLLSSPDKSALEQYDEKYASGDELGQIYTLVHQSKYQNFALQSELTEREVALREAQNIALRSQITPHFLFNTLEAINWRLFEKLPDEQEIPRMIQKLSLLFRMSLESSERLVPLEREIFYAKAYLDLQELRFQGQYAVTWEVSKESELCSVVCMSLQPLLENAISYGVTRVDNGRLVVRAHVEQDTFFLEVEDNGPGLSEEKLQKMQSTLRDSRYTYSNHIGLVNVNARVQLLFGVEYGLSVESVPFEHTRVILKMPTVFHQEGEETHV